ncbi:hypothetical protein EVAR_54085_1 [Eumeta japonica]|uniref:Uncharacterized protein n=1 Tax=Eumeta variegata TaxID=151549 RepID=A0A4C1XG32_EUMVA|nr:hypothetical protein EVAR_54085_1 [Eumeta japonica]
MSASPKIFNESTQVQVLQVITGSRIAPINAVDTPLDRRGAGGQRRVDSLYSNRNGSPLTAAGRLERSPCAPESTSNGCADGGADSEVRGSREKVAPRCCSAVTGRRPDVRIMTA